MTQMFGRNRIAIAILFAFVTTKLAARPQRDPTNAQPARFIISMPDYHRIPRDKWRDQTSEVYHQLDSIADEAMRTAADDRLSIDQRTASLMIVEQFSVKVTAKRLIEFVDLEDDRIFVSGDYHRGRWPIVAILASYGEAVIDHVRYAVGREESPPRRKRLCDVLEKVAGAQRASEILSEHLAESMQKESTKQNLQWAIDELNQRVDSPMEQ